MKPLGQLQVTLCWRTSHTAVGAQGLATTQGLRHDLSRQISWSPQSLLELQPEGGGGAGDGGAHADGGDHEALAGMLDEDGFPTIFTNFLNASAGDAGDDGAEQLPDIRPINPHGRSRQLENNAVAKAKEEDEGIKAQKKGEICNPRDPP